MRTTRGTPKKQTLCRRNERVVVGVDLNDAVFFSIALVPRNALSTRNVRNFKEEGNREMTIGIVTRRKEPNFECSLDFRPMH